jgi:hypothetical protein
VLDRPLVEAMGTLVHEMAHCWQHHDGAPSRRGYHNAEWADKMESIGLMPSDTGDPGGKRTGQRMTHYVVDGGPFLLAFEAMPPEYALPWRSGAVAQAPGPATPSKLKYACPECGINAWGKPELELVCKKCGVDLIRA